MSSCLKLYICDMKKLMITLICLFLFVNVFSEEVIVIDTSKAIFQKKALVILNGFGDSKKTEKYRRNFFRTKAMTYLFQNMSRENP